MGGGLTANRTHADTFRAARTYSRRQVLAQARSCRVERLWLSALLLVGTGDVESGRVLAHWKCADVRAPVYVVMREGRMEVDPSTPDACKEWSGACEAGVRPRGGEALALEVTGPGGAKVLQQPREENGFEARVLVPDFELDWNVGGDFPVFAPGPYELVMRLIPRAEADAGLRAPGELADERSKALALENRGDLAGALDAWERIALRASTRTLRLAALEKFYDLHPNVARALSDADRAKIEELERAGGPALEPSALEPALGRYVMGLWPADFAHHPSVARFVAELDAAFAAAADLTGENRSEQLGRRLCFVFVQSGAWYFDHHIGMNAEGFRRFPPFNSVYLHELGHGFFGYDGVAPCPGWGEGAASFAALRAMDFLGHDRWLLSICKEGTRQLVEFRASQRSPDESGPYLLGATIYALPDVESAVAAQRTWSWDAYGRMLRSLRAGGIAPHWPRDRYRHVAAAYAQAFGERMWSEFAELRWPVAPADAKRVRHEIDSVLPALARARAKRGGGEPEAALRLIEDLERDPDEHALHGEVRELALECLELVGSTSAAAKASAELGFARSWRIAAPIEELDERSRARVASIEEALARGPGAWSAERAGADVLHVERGFDGARIEAGVAAVFEAGFERVVEHTTARADGRVDLRELFGSEVRTPASVVAACIVDSPDERVVDLGLGRDDDLRVFFDGREVFRADGPSSVHADDGWARVRLRRGANWLALRVRNTGGDFGFSVRVARADGLGDPDVRVRAPAAAPERGRERVLWSIGALDGSYDELALARHHEEYAARFPDDVHFTVGKSEAARDWSYVQPAARDAWAGSRAHPFALRFRAASSHARRELRIATVSQNGWTPPTLRVALGEHTTEFTLPSGSDEALLDPHAARPCVLHVPIAPGDLRAGENEIVLTIVDGSWVLYDAVELVEYAD